MLYMATRDRAKKMPLYGAASQRIGPDNRPVWVQIAGSVYDSRGRGFTISSEQALVGSWIIPLLRPASKHFPS